jgi:deoxyribodipyrimidine photolyase
LIQARLIVFVTLLRQKSESHAPQQRDYLKQHKAEIITELQQADNPLLVTCYTPASNAIQVEAKDEVHCLWTYYSPPETEKAATHTTNQKTTAIIKEPAESER